MGWISARLPRTAWPGWWEVGYVMSLTPFES